MASPLSKYNHNKDFDFKNEDEIKRILRTIPTNTIYQGISYVGKGSVNWLEHTFFVSINSRQTIDSALLYSHVMDVELLSLLFGVYNNALFNISQMFYKTPIGNPNLEFYYSFFHDYFMKIEDVKIYIENEIKEYL